MTRRPLAAPSAVLLVVLLLAAGCGGQGSDETATDAAAEPTSSSASPSESPAESPSSSEESPAPPPTPPRCDRVWVAEAPLAWDYRGCLRDGRLVKADKETCTNGQQLVRFDGRFYGAVGGKVLDEGDLATSERFQKALRACHG